MPYLYEMLLSFMLSAITITILKPVALKIGLIDTPDSRKKHSHPVPLIGGIAIAVAYTMTAITFDLLDAAHKMGLWSVLIIVIAGFVDDYDDIKPISKFLLQCLTALFLIFILGFKVQHLGNLLGFGNIDIPEYLQAPFTMIAIVGMMNAINMSDGLDGLAGLIGISMLGAFAFLAASINDVFHVHLLLTFIGAIAGFLLFNLPTPFRKNAEVFMGDAGSMLIGLAITSFSIHLSSHSNSPLNPILFVWICGIPLLDMASVILRRINTESGLTTADHAHLHHILLYHLGYSKQKSLYIKWMIVNLFAAIGIIAHIMKIPDYILFYSFIMSLVIYHFTVCRIVKIKSVQYISSPETA